MPAATKPFNLFFSRQLLWPGSLLQPRILPLPRSEMRRESRFLACTSRSALAEASYQRVDCLD